jgi:NADPH-dependent curcumin reductase CurA
MPTANRQLRVRKWPDGLPQPSDFELCETATPEPGEAQVLIRNLWLSIDPYDRHALGPRFLGTPFRNPGDVMMAVTLGQVMKSRDPLAAEGAYVTMLKGDMQDFAIVAGRDLRLLPPEIFGKGGLPLQTALGVAGLPGLTAYAALVAHAKCRPGETFVVSSAGGCVGATAGQLARLMGLRAVGIAGAPEKRAWVIEKAGFEACVSYRSADFAAELAVCCPRGVDVNMEHVGGAVLAAVLGLMVYGGRVVLSGLIDQYNQAVAPPGPNWGVIVARSLTVTGLRVFDHLQLMGAFERMIAPRILDGSFAYAEDILTGLEQPPLSLARVLSGANFGRSLVKI